MVEKWKAAVDNGGVFAALLTDLSKVFDCTPHDLITARLTAYGFDTNALKLIHNYLFNSKQRVKINNAYGKIYFMVFHKVPSLDPFFLIYTYVICFIS